MPDTRTHRGPHPDDARQFASDAVPRLRAAVADLSWLLTHGYSPPSALKLVGDRYGLLARQRVAVARSACSDAHLATRRARQIEPAELRGRSLWLDGYNVLTTVEAALSGGVIFAARDSCWRDMASMHGSYRRVAETRPALDAIGRVLGRLGVSEAVWWLDRPVSNSGRLRACILEVAAAAGWPWRVELVPDPDPVLAAADVTVATADSAVLDEGPRWLNLARIVVAAEAPDAWVVDLS